MAKLRVLAAIVAALVCVANPQVAVARGGGGHGGGHGSSHSGSHSSSHRYSGAHHSGYSSHSSAGLATSRASVAHSTQRTTSTSHAIKGHYSKDGTYVAPSRATNPNHTRADNYSAKGNVNPYSGKVGTKSIALNNSIHVAVPLVAGRLTNGSQSTRSGASTYAPTSPVSPGYVSSADAGSKPELVGAAKSAEEQPTARCADGSTTTSQNKSIACGTRGGVAQWLR